ncbi:MAG: hypothetical protein IT169_12430 [Bryobacterales bacterium]|nr:hypothetical protein [Bryobacterales bacterium]
MNGRHSWLFLMAGSLSLAGSQWLTLWLLARTAPPEVVGRYGLALGWVLPACALAALQLRALMATEPQLVARFPAYLRLRLFALGGFALVLAPLFWIDLPGFGSGALLGAIGINRLVELASDFVDALRHRDRSYLALGFSQCCRSGAGFSAFALIWLSTRSLVSAILAATLLALCSAILVDFPALRRFWAARSHAVAKESKSVVGAIATAAGLRSILGFAVPLALVQFLNLGVVTMPRLLLGAWSSLEAVASFTCLAAVLSVASLLASAYAASLAPDLAEAFRAQDATRAVGSAHSIPNHRSHSTVQARDLLRRAACNVSLGSLPLIAMLAICGEPALRMLYGTGIAFPQGAIVLTALFAAIWSLAAVFGTAATAARRIGLQLWAFGLALVSGAVTGAFLVPAHGVAGASASLLVSAIVLLSIYLLSFRRLWLAPCREAQNLFPDARYGAAAD